MRGQPSQLGDNNRANSSINGITELDGMAGGNRFLMSAGRLSGKIPNRRGRPPRDTRLTTVQTPYNLMTQDSNGIGVTTVQFGADEDSDMHKATAIGNIMLSNI